MHHLHPFFKFFSRRPTPYFDLEDQKLPSWAFYDPLQIKVIILPHHVYNAFEIWRQKLHTILGQKSTRIRQKVRSERIFCVHFKKNSQETRPPPYCGRIKNSTLGLELILYSKDENWHDISKKWAQNAPFTSIFNKFPGGGPPDPHLQEGYPLSQPPHAALHAHYVTPPPPG